MIDMKNVSVIYDNGAVALENVNVHIGKGEFVFIVGASGAGKSTFVKLLLREILPTRDSIRVNGNEVVNIQHVEFQTPLLAAPRRQLQRSVNSVLDVVGLREKYKCFPNQLSGGEQQRVAIARAIVNDPAILIADEPTGNLDPETSWEIMDIFRRINAVGTTIVMATHDKTIVDTMKKRVIAINDGHIVRDDVRGGYGYEDADK